MEFKLTNGIEKKSDNQQISQADLGFGSRARLGADKSADHLNSYEARLLASDSTDQNKAPKFFSLSLGIHALALLSMAMMTVPVVEQPNNETITIELEKVKPEMRVQAKGDDVMPSPMGSTMRSAPKMGADNDSEEIAETRPAKVAAAPAVSAKNLAPAASKIIAKSIPKSIADAAANESATKAEQAIEQPMESEVERSFERAAVQKAPPTAPRATAKTTLKAVPMTIDDIEAPPLDQGDLATKTVKADLSDDLKNDIDEDFSRIDQTHSQALAAEKAKMDDLASDLSSKQEDKLHALEEENKKESVRFKAHQQSLRKNNEDALAKAEAKEREEASAAAAAASAAELAAAQKEAVQQARAKKEAAQAAATKNAALRNSRNLKNSNASNGVGVSHGSGVGINNDSGLGSDLASNGKGPHSGDPGSPSGNVRSLDQLRQMPGNPRPQYDAIERRRGDQGSIAFFAYVSKEGNLNRFTLKKSTGFRNLDSKTLAALKKWRFHPGQEGWVELPFQWDIKGGVQEMGGRLRTNVSKR